MAKLVRPPSGSLESGSIYRNGDSIGVNTVVAWAAEQSPTCRVRSIHLLARTQLSACSYFPARTS